MDSNHTDTRLADGARGLVASIAGDESSTLLGDWVLMTLIRKFEEKVRELKLAGEISGSVHLGIGQESVPVGVVSAIRPERDVVFATYRGHGWALACGTSVRRMFAEIPGRADGLNGGRAGSAYLTDSSVGFMGENSIVGAGASHAVGAAMQGVFDGGGRRAVAVIGDGALNQGAVHEAMNFAAHKRLPVLFVVENNKYSEMTQISDMVADDRLWKRAEGYGFAGVRVDGNNTDCLRGVVREWIRDEPRPLLIEAMTQRLVGHTVGDALVYRSQNEIDELALVEPVQAAVRKLVLQGIDSTRLEVLGGAIDSVLQAALDEARRSEWSSTENVRRHIYA